MILTDLFFERFEKGGLIHQYNVVQIDNKLTFLL